MTPWLLLTIAALMALAVYLGFGHPVPRVLRPAWAALRASLVLPFAALMFVGVLTRGVWRRRRRSPGPSRPGRRMHVGPAERHARAVLGMAKFHPERIKGQDRAARRKRWRQWTAELARDGVDAGQIIDQYRRGL